MPATAQIIDLATRSVRSQLLADLDFYVLNLKSENKNPRTVETYSEAIRQFESFQTRVGSTTDTAEVTKADVQSFVRDQLTRYKATSAQTRLAALRAFFSWAVRESILDASQRSCGSGSCSATRSASMRAA